MSVGFVAERVVVGAVIDLHRGKCFVVVLLFRASLTHAFLFWVEPLPISAFLPTFAMTQDNPLRAAPQPQPQPLPVFARRIQALYATVEDASHAAAIFMAQYPARAWDIRPDGNGHFLLTMHIQ